MYRGLSLKYLLTVLVLTVLLVPLSLVTVYSQSDAPIAIRNVEFSPDGMMLATSTSSGILNLWDLANGAQLHSIRAHDGVVAALAWSQDGQRIASGGGDKIARIWDTQTGSLITALGNHGQGVASIAWSIDGNYIYTGETDPDFMPMLQKWDADRGTLLASTQQVAGALELSPDEKLLFAGNGIYKYAFDADSLEMVANYSLPSDYNNNYQAIEISIAPDGKNIAIGYLNGWVRIWDVERQQIISQFAAHEEHPQCCHSEYAAVTAIHFDGKFLTTVTSDGTFRRWDSSTQELITDMQTSPTMQLAKFSEYGGRLIIVKDNATTIDGIPGIEIVVPDPSLERLNSIAQGCISAVGQRSVAFATDEAQLSDFTAQIESLSDEQIPPGCKADLLAIIEAIEAQ